MGHVGASFAKENIMQNRRSLKEDIEAMVTLKVLVTEYEQISVMHMQKVRDKVLNGRFFLDGLSYVFKDVKFGYRKQLESLLKKNKKAGHAVLTTLNKNGKSVTVVLTANATLYGSIVKRVYDLFLDHVTKNETEVVIIGKIGKGLYEKAGVPKPYTYFEIPDVSTSVGALKDLLLKLTSYQKVDVFFGKFYNVMNQMPTASNISGQQIFEVEIKEEEKYQAAFEPNVEKIFQFFEMQVFNNLFYQAVQEAELARHGSRISKMEEALGNISRGEQTLSHKYNRLKKRIENKKRLEGLAGMSLWQ